MAKPKALILTGYGINCDVETQYVFERAGGRTERVHVNDLIDGRRRMENFQILAFPGGFSFGDDIASGRVLANKVATHLREPLLRFVEDGKLVLGVCNGFQVMVKCGLIAAGPEILRGQGVTLTYNDSNRYEDRWVHLKVQATNCVFLRGVERLYLPVAHGEGKFFAPGETLDRLEAGGQVALRYVREDGSPAGGRFPDNPNGSLRDIAGVCDPAGRVFGLMPHPERFNDFTNHPRWTALADRLRREGRDLPEDGDGMAIFRNAVSYFE